MKYKAGDKVRCVKPSAAAGVRVGKVFTVKGFNHNSEFGTHIKLEEVCSTPTECVFELVASNPVLTPEEVFEHLRKGKQLQWSDKGKDNWCTVLNPNGVSVGHIGILQWRIKPEPEVIELNGKKYREIME